MSLFDDAKRLSERTRTAASSYPRRDFRMATPAELDEIARYHPGAAHQAWQAWESQGIRREGPPPRPQAPAVDTTCGGEVLGECKNPGCALYCAGMDDCIKAACHSGIHAHGGRVITNEESRMEQARLDIAMQDPEFRMAMEQPLLHKEFLKSIPQPEPQPQVAMDRLQDAVMSGAFGEIDEMKQAMGMVQPGMTRRG